mmetsp:Transcript_55150/g.118450  ORF Transcript_55150/g.118450 Transcript_55150/m.118450 type:complete len:212 (+) Transcript_55150:2505-3140(+)
MRYSKPVAPPRTARTSFLSQRSNDDSRPGFTKPRLPRKTSTSSMVQVTASRGSLTSVLLYLLSSTACGNGIMSSPMPWSCPSHSIHVAVPGLGAPSRSFCASPTLGGLILKSTFTQCPLEMMPKTGSPRDKVPSTLLSRLGAAWTCASSLAKTIHHLPSPLELSPGFRTNPSGEWTLRCNHGSRSSSSSLGSKSSSASSSLTITCAASGSF